MNVSEWVEAGKPLNIILHGDCMDLMPLIPEMGREVLAVVDPPYGINIAEWDGDIPDKIYFDELIRVSENQIIFGGNYFNLKHTESWICWDKTYRFNRNIDLSEFEMIWTSFEHKAKFLRYTYCGNFYGYKNNVKAHYNKPQNIHICQKPIDVYRWILQNYAKPGQLILDTHSGSGSLACAAHLEGFDFIAIEKDFDYWKDSTARLKELRDQGRTNNKYHHRLFRGPHISIISFPDV